METSIFTQFSSAGGEKTFSCKGRSLAELLALAINSANSGGRIILYDLERMEKTSLERIAHTGKGNILFDHR